MNQENTPSLLDDEIAGFHKLEEKIERVLDRLAELKTERDETLKQKTELENILRQKEAQINQLQERLIAAEQRTLSPEKEEMIRSRLKNLIDKLEDFQ